MMKRLESLRKICEYCDYLRNIVKLKFIPMWIHIIESFASIFFMNQSVDSQNRTWQWYAVEFKDVAKGVSYSIWEKSNQIVFCDAAGHMLMFGNNSDGSI